MRVYNEPVDESVDSAMDRRAELAPKPMRASPAGTEELAGADEAAVAAGAGRGLHSSTRHRRRSDASLADFTFFSPSRCFRFSSQLRNTLRPTSSFLYTPSSTTVAMTRYARDAGSDAVEFILSSMILLVLPTASSLKKSVFRRRRQYTRPMTPAFSRWLRSCLPTASRMAVFVSSLAVSLCRPLRTSRQRRWKKWSRPASLCGPPASQMALTAGKYSKRVSSRAWQQASGEGEGDSILDSCFAKE